MKVFKTCEICGASASKYHKMNNINIYKCPNCNFIFSDRDSEIEFSYETDLYVDLAENEVANREFYARARFKLLKKYQKNIASILDVGCSSGIFLNAIKSKVQRCKGNDLSKKAVELARTKELDVELKSIYDEDNSYDAITLVEVIEHISDLNLLLTKIYELLNNDGIFYFQTGNTSSLEFFLAKRNWKYFDPPSHCSYLGRKSIKLLFEKSGFKILYLGTCVDLWSYLTTPNKPYNSISTLKGIIGKLHFKGFTIPSTIGVIAQKAV